MSVAALPLLACGRQLSLGERPWLMGIVNATPDSFSDDGTTRTLESRVALAAELLDAGADIIDIGGESGVTNRPPVAAEEEIARVVPLIKRVSGELGAVVSVDTYKPLVARAAIEAGATIVNDVSGLADLELADVCAASGAGLVLMHTRVPPKVKLLDPDAYADVVADVADFLADRMRVAVERGVTPEQIILDPGPDFAKTPAQTIASLRGLHTVTALGRPVLLAISRKDFIGAITGRSPRERLAGTLAALAWGWQAGGHIFRVHDVREAAEFLAVLDVLDGRRDIAGNQLLAEELRREPVAGIDHVG